MDEFQEQIVTRAADEAGLSRRHFLRSVGLAAGGVGLLGRGPAVAQQPPPSPIEVLQFALALEHLEAVFYQHAVGFLTQQPASDRTAARAAEIAVIVRKNEQTHEQALASAITCAGATPVPRCQYTFRARDVSCYLQIARTLEETGVSAYLGTIPLLLGAPAVLVEASMIVTMEARHASLFRFLLQESDPISGTGAMPTCEGAFGNGAFDRLALIPEVRAAAAPFTASATCPPLRP